MEMIDVITKLREIAGTNEEAAKALDNATRMSGQQNVAEGVQITVSGSDAVLHQILKLAGMIGADTMEEETEAVHDANRPYASSPDEVVLDFDTAVPHGTDMHGLGADGHPAVAGAGNPMRPAI